VSSLESLASVALKKAERLGASQVEVFIISSHGRSVYVENSKLGVADDKSETGLSVKACLGKRVGSSSGTVSQNSVEEIVNEALSIARTTENDPYFKSLPSGVKFSGQVKDAYSEETAQISLEEIVARAMDTVKAAEKTRSVKVPLGLIRLSDYSLHVVNSLGVNFSHKGTMVFSYFKSKAAVGDRAGEGIEKEWSTDISRLDFEKIGRSIADKAVATMNAESFKEERNVTALVIPIELEGLLFVVEFATSAEQVNKKRSPWINQLGAQVASEKLTVWDDGRYPSGIRSAIADDEGVQTSKKTIIDQGKLQSYIYDSYNAGIADVKATGNGFRRGTRSIEGAFALPTGCTYANMVVKPGNKKLDNLISRIDKGVLIETFAAPEVNPVTGGFGCEVRNATLIEGGQLTKHVRHALLTGNMYEALKNMFDVGAETKMVENTVLPPIAFSNVKLVGQK
jgi:PmbA protein